MTLMMPHLSFLLLSVFLLYLIKNKSFSGLIHILISFISFLFSIHILINKNIFLYKEINVIEVLENITISFNLDYLGLVFLVVSNGLWFMTSIYANRYLKLNDYSRHGSFFIFFLISMMSTNAIIYSANLFTTFIFYEILTLATYPLVVFKSDEKSILSGKKYLYYLLGTSIIFLLPAIIITYNVTGTLAYTENGIFSAHDYNLINLLIVLFLFGVAKSAIMPFHKWLPTAMVAPTPVSALLHAVAVVKSGVYILIKIMIYIFGLNVLKDIGANLFILFASLTIILSSIIALKQDSIKLRLAYSTIGQLSYIVLGVAILAPYSILASVLHIIFHALGKIILFLASGSIATQTGIKNVTKMDNLSSRLPYTCLLMSLGALIMVGLPPTIGFISKWYLVIGIIESNQLYLLIIIIASTILNASYYFPLIYRSYFISKNINLDMKNEEDIQLIAPVIIIGLISIILFFNLDSIIMFLEENIILK
jgi:multicomponent Na+:H+ antiporter subunit D